MSDEADNPSEELVPHAPLTLRRRNRLVVVQFVYAWEANPGQSVEHAIEQFFKELELKPEKYVFADALIRGVLEFLPEVDKVIKSSVPNWDFDRIAKVDLAILRLAVYELLHCNDIPPIVSINEAIELSKLLSGAESKRFINGVLDQLKLSLLRPLRQASGDVGG